MLKLSDGQEITALLDQMITPLPSSHVFTRRVGHPKPLLSGCAGDPVVLSNAPFSGPHWTWVRRIHEDSRTINNDH